MSLNLGTDALFLFPPFFYCSLAQTDETLDLSSHLSSSSSFSVCSSCVCMSSDFEKRHTSNGNGSGSSGVGVSVGGRDCTKKWAEGRGDCISTGVGTADDASVGLASVASSRLFFFLSPFFRWVNKHIKSFSSLNGDLYIRWTEWHPRKEGRTVCVHRRRHDVRVGRAALPLFA